MSTEIEVIAYESGITWEKYEKCSICGIKYKRSKLTRYRGKWYCFPLGCYKDINRIVSTENDESWRTSRERESYVNDY